jgi:hypothetical protein
MDVWRYAVHIYDMLDDIRITYVTWIVGLVAHASDQ